MEINNRYESSFIESKSKFIAILIPLNSPEDYKNKLEEIKNIYKDATHYCYAYVYDGYAKSSDDNEPKGTAGKPILRILNLKNLNRVILIVVRYFGGIKLGASKLLRTYVKSASEVVNLIK